MLRSQLVARLERYYMALQRKGPRRLLQERYNQHVRHGLLRRRVYPRMAELQYSVLKLDNARRRRQLGLVTRRPARAGRLFVVICVDAEGPNVYGKHHSWSAIEGEFRALADPSFRAAHCDALGRPFSVDWFVVDWPRGEPNQRRLELGIHGILDHYVPLVKHAREGGYGDAIHWHYHHVPRGRVDGYNRDWQDHRLYEEILCRRLIERDTWPVIYRAGNTWEDDTCSRWLERWIPFDFSSRAPQKNVHYDWSRAPRRWVVYHPHSHNFRRHGSMRRWIARSLDVEKNYFRPVEVEQAFLDAREGRDSYVSFYVHDFNAMHEYIARGVDMIRTVASDYPEVHWQFADALTALRQLARLTPSNLQLTGERKGQDISVQTSHEIFGEPWLAVESSQQFSRIDMRRLDSRTWHARIAESHEPNRICVAATDPAGQIAIFRL